MLNSSLVYTTARPDIFNIPEAMGQPSDGQATGTALELLAETAGRVCYDSYGKGRSSLDYHKHIIEVGHLSVYEHCTFTIQFEQWRNEWATALLNRPGVYANLELSTASQPVMRITTNARAVMEWDKRTTLHDRAARLIGANLKAAASQLMPAVIASPRVSELISHLVPPMNTNEVWISAWLRGSRGFSHEMVRHGDWSAISQRSTRYVDESASNICWSPDLYELLRRINEDPATERDMTITDLVGFDYTASGFACRDIVSESREVYNRLANLMTKYGFDRKAARSAARGALPTALETQMIFSASLSQWNHIFSMRCSPFADAEIRAIMLNLKKQVHGERINTDEAD